MSFGFGVSVGDGIAVYRLVSDLRKRFKDSPAEYRAISQEVTSLSHILRDLKEDASEDLTDEQKSQLNDIIRGCRNVLEDLHAKTEKYHVLESSDEKLGGKTKRAWKRLKWEPEDIKSLRLRVVSNIELLNAFNGSSTRQHVVRITKTLDTQERRVITNWLSPIDHSARFNELVAKHQEGTGQWLLNSSEYKTWLDGSRSEDKRLLFCPGIPGAGKTFLTSIVITNLWDMFESKSDIAIAYAFCDYTQQHEQTSANMLSSMLKQLVQKQHNLPDEIKKLYEQSEKGRTRMSLTEILAILEDVVSSYSRVFFVIDALDEFANPERNGFLREILRLHKKTGSYIFATSRPNAEIENVFEGSLQMEIRATKYDIRRYLDNNIQNLPICVRKNPEMQKQVMEKIISVNDGMFLLAQLHLDSLRYKTDRTAVKLALKNLHQGPEVLNSAYKGIIERIEAQPVDHRDLARRVILWTAFSGKPLRINELQHALAVQVGDSELDEDKFPEVEDMVSACAGLVTIERESGIVRLVHLTAQNYLERAQIPWLLDANAKISNICLTYLSLDVHGDGLSQKKHALDEKLDKNPFLAYAARNWVDHACKATASIDQDLALAFLKDDFKFNSSWEVYCAAWGVRWRPYENVLFSNDYYSDYRESIKSFSALHFAAYFGLEEISSALLRCGGLPDEPDWNGKSPLSYAAENGHEKVCNLLLNMADIPGRYIGPMTETPLELAAANGHEAIVKLLLNTEGFSANVNLADFLGRTPLWEAAENGHETVVKLLLSVTGIEMNLKNWKGETALHIAAYFGHEAIVKLLLSVTGIEISSKNNEGQTPLYHAAERGYEAIFKLLLKTNKIDVNSRDVHGRSFLSAAAGRGRKGVVKLLLATPRVDVNSKDIYDQTPLSEAASRGHEAIVALLLGVSDIEVDPINFWGQTPLLVAKARGHRGVVKLLLQAGAIKRPPDDEIEKRSISRSETF